MEQFNIYHNNKYKCRNRAEYRMIGYIQKLLSSSVGMTIEQIRDWCIKTCITDMEKSKGRITFSEIHVSGSVIGDDNWVKRGFAMYGPGRGTYTVSITESLFKDASDNYSVVKHEINNNTD